MNETPAAPAQYDPVNTAQTFFNRTQITGAEVEAYVQAYNWLESLKTGELITLPTDSLTRLREQVAEQVKVVAKLQEKIVLLKEQLKAAGVEDDNPSDPIASDDMISEGGPVELEEV